MEKSWEKNKETSISESIFAYFYYWKWFIFSVFVCLVIGAAVAITTTKVYRSSISVLLKEEKGSNGPNSSGFSLDELGLLSTTNNIDNEIALLSSPDLMRGVVDSLNLETTYYTKKRFRKTELYKTAPFHVNYTGVSEDLPGFVDFYITKDNSNYIINGKYTDRGNNEHLIKETFENLPVDIILPNNAGEIHIKLTGKEISPKEKYYATIFSRTTSVSNICSNLSVIPTAKKSSALILNLRVNNPEKGAAILRELIRQYNAMNVRVNNEIAYNTALFINDRLKEIASELGDVESDVVTYKQKHQIADLSSEAQLSIQQTGLNKEKVSEIETQLNVLSLVDQFVNDPTNRLKIIPNLGISDPGLSAIISEYNNKLLSSDALLKSTGEENPMRMRVTEEIENMRSSIGQSLLNVKQAYTISKRDLLRMSSSTQSRIQSIPQQEKGLLERVRQQQVKENLFLFLMQKREETNISIASTSDKARIITSPQTYISPIEPRRKVILLTAIVLGLLIPVVIIYTLNLLKTQIRNRDELEKLSIVNIVGQIARNETKNSIVLKKGENSGIAEMFRTLRNNLNFIIKNEEKAIILVTSSIAGEGKTFISVNLAMSFALSDKKVLIVGADIRNPRLNDYINVNKHKGLTDFLVSSDTDWKSYIYNSKSNPNLDIMLAGTIPPNPNELLMSPKLKSFLKQIKNDYDIVVLDTAPVGLVSDTYLITDLTDVTLYIVREGVTPKAVVNFINTQKEENKLKNMYLVLNDSSLERNYGYQYGYGKKYGYDSKK